MISWRQVEGTKSLALANASRQSFVLGIGKQSGLVSVINTWTYLSIGFHHQTQRGSPC